MISYIKKNGFELLIIVIFAAVYAFCFDVKPSPNGDNAQYIRLAYNIAKGLGYSDISPLGISPASHYPPGYSFFLAILIKLGINNILSFKLFNGIMLLISLLLMFNITKAEARNTRLAFVAVILSIFSPRLINFGFMAMSEMMYMLLTVICTYALYMYNRASVKTDKKTPFHKSPYFYLAVVAAASSYYVRTIGVSAIFAVIIFFAFRKEWKAALSSVAGAFLILLPWSIRNSLYGIEFRYFGTIMTVNPWRPEQGTISSVSEMIEKMVVNFDDTVIKGFRTLLFPFSPVDYKVPSDALWLVIGLLVVAVTIYGAWNFGKLRYFMLAFFVANIGVFMLWHGANEERYVIPLVPFIFACFWVGAYKLISLKKQISPLVFLLLIIPMLSPLKNLREVSQMEYPAGVKNYYSMMHIIDQHLGEGTVICCRKPEFLSFYAKDVIGTNYAYSLDDKELILDLVRKKVDYVILDNLGYSSTVRYLYPAIQKNPDLFGSVTKLDNPTTVLLKFNRDLAIEKFSAN